MGTPKSLTPAQLATLRRIASEFDKTVARWIEHQGRDEAERLAAKPPVSLTWDGLRVATWRRLVVLGLIDVEHKRREYQRLDTGPYGRWQGGTITERWIETFARPTALGRAVLAAHRKK